MLHCLELLTFLKMRIELCFYQKFEYISEMIDNRGGLTQM